VGSIKARLKRALEKSGLARHELVCPECAAEFVCWGEPALDFMVAHWRCGVAEAHGLPIPDADALVEDGTPPDVAALFDHEHDPTAFLDKKAGLPFLSWEVSGMRIYGPASRWIAGDGE
jgi:hypothetical protein